MTTRFAQKLKSAAAFAAVCLALGTGCVRAQTPAVARAGQSVLKNPNPPAPPNFGWWDQYAEKEGSPKAATAKATIAYRKDAGQLVANLTLNDQSAGPTFNTYTGSLASLPAGTLLHLSYTLSGNLAQPKPNNRPTVVTTISIFGRTGGSHDIVFSPSAAGAPVLKGAGPLTGQFGPLPVSVVFALPANVDQVKVLNLATNATGTVEIKGLSLTIGEAGLAANVAPVADFLTPEQADAAALEKYNAYWTAEVARLGIPDADKIYAPKAALGGAHPRFLFAGLPLAALKQRMADPALAGYAADLYKVADRYASAPPPARPNMSGEDPLREYSNRLAWIALACLTTDDAAKKQSYLNSTIAYVNAYTSWGPPAHDLPLSQMMLGMGEVYDWLYNDLPADTKAKARQYLIDSARFMRFPENVSAWQWRSGGNWLANHKWYNYGALAMAASVLWGDTNAPLKPGEQKLWMDEAMQVFWVVRKTFGADGAPVEGYNYQSYGLSPYFDFAVLADQLTQTTVSFVDTPGIRNIGVSRLHSLLPGNAGFFVYADSDPKVWGGSVYFRFVASRFHDPVSQRLADIMESGESHSDNPNEYYDMSLPAYKDAAAQSASSPAGVAPIILSAESFTRSEGAGSLAMKNGSLGMAIKGWDQPDTQAEASFTVPQGGPYELLFKYATQGVGSRQILIDGKVPFREAGYVPFQSTGGFSTDSNQWRFVYLGEEVPGFTQPWLFSLTPGRHTLTLRNDLGNGLNLNWVVVVPAGMAKEAVIAKAGDTDAHVLPVKAEMIRDWHGLFWYDPTVPSAKLATQPTHHDNDDLGIYTNRSSWTDPHATFMGFKAGPVAGKGVLESISGLWSGHSQPDQGMFQFYYGSHPVVPGSDYAHKKMTTDHAVVVLEGSDKRSAGQLIGQYGEGGQWFSNNWKSIKSSPTTLWSAHTPAYQSFLAEIGGVYQPSGGNNKATRDANTVTSYRRSVTYLPSGVVVVVDKIEAPTPQTYRFRIPTLAKDMAAHGRAFDFTIGRVPGRIIDFSPQAYETMVTHEPVESYRNPGSDPTTRDVAVLRATGQPQAIFAAVLGMNGAEKGISVQASDTAIVITGAPGGTINLDWKPQAQPLSADPTKPAATTALLK